MMSIGLLNMRLHMKIVDGHRFRIRKVCDSRLIFRQWLTFGLTSRHPRNPVLAEVCVMDTLLTAIVGFTQLILGGMGIYVSLMPPKNPRRHRYWIGAFLVVGALGVALTGWLARRSSNAQENATARISEAVTQATNANTAATNANNASIASGWVPSLLFGIPGDTIAAIAIGVLYMKGLNPGPTLFTEKASSMYAIYLMFIIANILMIPLGIVMIRLAAYVLRAPRASVMPVIMLCCAVGSFAIGNNMFGVVTVATFGIIGYVMEANGYPVAAMVLGIVMGTMVEQAFVTSLIKSDGSILPFFERPIAAILAAMAIGALVWPVLVWVWRKLKGEAPAAASAR